MFRTDQPASKHRAPSHSWNSDAVAGCIGSRLPRNGLASPAKSRSRNEGLPAATPSFLLLSFFLFNDLPFITPLPTHQILISAIMATTLNRYK